MNKLRPALFVAILLLGFLVRLYKIDNPIADWHSWRQADTTTVTRNFVKYGVNPFIPRYDDFFDASGKGYINPSGFRMVEFPIFNLIHFTFYKIYPVLGLVYWGRMTAILSWLLAGSVLFFIVRRHSSQATAYLAMGLFLFLPYGIYFSRIILPDQLMVALALLTLNSFDLWNKNPKKIHLFLTILFGAMAILVKPLAIFLLLPMIWQAKDKLRDFRVYLIAACIVLPFLLWRQWISKFPEGIPAFVWLLNGNNIRFRPAFFRWMFGERLASLILGKWGIASFFMGVVASFSSPYLLTWVVGALLYVVIFATGNIQHDYYQILIMPAVSVVTALGLSKLFQGEKTIFATLAKRTMVVASVCFMLAFSWYDIVGNYQVNHWEILEAGDAIQRLTNDNAVVLASYMGDTAFLYQTNRRGFALLPAPIKDLKDLWGVSYYVSTNFDEEANKLMNKYTIVEETPRYVVVRLEEPDRPLPK